MKIVELYMSSEQPVLSLEIFPPNVVYPLETVFDTLNELIKLKAKYISVTYPGGDNRIRTVEIAARIKKQFGIETQAHLTCIGHTAEEVDKLLEELTKESITNIMALRGDFPPGPVFNIDKQSFRYANELVRFIKNKGDFGVAAAAHPEGHPECSRLKEDLLHLKQKVEAGVDFLITQLFFDNRIYYDFIDKALSIGIACPVIPGIMPVLNPPQIKKMIYLNGGSLPAALIKIIDKYENQSESMEKAGIEYAVRQIEDLVKNGVAGIHMYTMNKATQISYIVESAGLGQNSEFE